MEPKLWPSVGCGIGLRSQHYPDILGHWPSMDWFEAISENYMDTGGRPLHVLEQVRHHYPVALHGTALSIGSTDPLNPDYLNRLKRLVDRIDPFIVSDHLCWSGVGRESLHDLLPLPFTEDAICHVANRVEQVQDALGRKILIENVSTYVTYRHSAMPEWEFLSQIARRSGCGILLDLNNIYVNAKNHQFDPIDYLNGVPGELVGQFHLAGHTDMGKFLFDTHSDTVLEAVWNLYREALKRWGRVSTLIEWDENIPSFVRLCEEAEKARTIYQSCSTQEIVRSNLNQTASPRLPADSSAVISLSELQDKFKKRILPERRAFDPKETLLNRQGGEAGESRLDVYAGGYVARVRESLTEVYEAVRQILGPDRFGELCASYVAKHHSQDYNLNYVGRYLSSYLVDSEWSKEFPFLADLAQLEWQINQAFHSFDEVPLNPADIRSIPPEKWENLRIVFQPSVSLLSTHWPVLDLWLGRHQPIGKLSAHKTQIPERILIGRRELKVRCERLDHNQFELVRHLLGGETLGDACEKLVLAEGEAAPPVGSWFARWVGDALIVRCDLMSETSV